MHAISNYSIEPQINEMISGFLYTADTSTDLQNKTDLVHYFSNSKLFISLVYYINLFLPFFTCSLPFRLSCIFLMHMTPHSLNDSGVLTGSFLEPCCLVSTDIHNTFLCVSLGKALFVCLGVFVYRALLLCM